MSQEPIIEIEHLTKRFKDLIAVNDLNLRIEEGDAFGFLGPNGAGKTTTIKMLTGFMRPTSGTIKVMGRDMFRTPKKAKLRFGLVPDHFGFYDDLTAMEHLYFYGSLFGIPKNELASRSEEVLKMVSMSEKQHIKTKEFSHGMQQRLVIAQALLNRPKVLFLDEPTTGLDPRGSYEIREIIKRLAKEGLTIFISSHLLWEVQELCTKVGIIDRGTLLRLDTIDRLSDELSMKSGIIVHMDVTEVPEAAISAVKALKGVVNVEAGLGWMRVKVEEHSVSPEVPAAFVRGGGRFRTCYEMVPNLEQIFLELTGGSVYSATAGWSSGGTGSQGYGGTGHQVYGGSQRGDHAPQPSVPPEAKPSKVADVPAPKGEVKREKKGGGET
jgi:ABC-2 type transport system ATP-binding protein